MTLPYRVVDHDNQGWYITGNQPGGWYEADYGFMRDLPGRNLSDLERDRGPLRPVLPITNEDSDRLRDIFATTKRKTVTTIAAALEEVFHAVREEQGGLSTRHSYDYAMRTLTAGREGSWESEMLKDVILFGNGLNLAPARRGMDNSVEVRRLRGPHPSRVDVAARKDLAEMFTRWVTDPGRYTEVAETLVKIVSQHADRTAGPDGWRAVADQWLQPGGLARADFVICYRLLYSLSQHFDTSLL